MFDAAGGFDGTLTLAYNADGGHKEWVDAACVSISNALGVECQGKAYPTFAELRNDVTEDKMTGLFRTGWQMDYPSMQNFLAPIYATNAGSNDGGYSNEEFDTLLRDAAGQLVGGGHRQLPEGARTSSLRTCRSSRCGTAR